MPAKSRPKLYLLWRAITLTKRYYRRGRRFASMVRTQGLARAVAETRAPAIAPVIVTDASIADDRYQHERDAEAQRVADKLAAADEQTAQAFLREHGITDLDRVVIYPVDSPERTQRPEHVLRAYAERGYRCLMLMVEGGRPHTETIGPGIIRTNRHGEVLRALRDRPVVFYLTCPFFRFLPPHLPRAVLHYDVIAELRVFSRHCDRMIADHQALLRSAAVTTFSSHELLEASRGLVRHPHLLLDGEWASEIAPPADPVERRAVDWGIQAAPVIDAVERAVWEPARRSRSRRVDLLNVNFFDWDGEVLYKGGAERYVHDLACLLAEEGWEPRILQNATKPFVREHRGVPVIGVATGLGYDLRGISRAYGDYCKDADLLIASPAELACQLDGRKVIGINHGIYWDHSGRKLDRQAPFEHGNVFDALAACRATVAVDTNFANWVRTFDYGLARNIVYVPNYWDRNDFSPSAKRFDGKLRVIYPRRLYEPRGIFLTIQAFERLLPRHPELELYLVGQANEQDSRAVRAFMDRFPGRVAWDEFDMHEMQQAYRDTHIALIPTLWSEGTSLSCLEAMATGHAVVATNIGGLPNLVTDRHNGFLIHPTAEALIDAVEALICDRPLAERMARRGIDLAAVFEKAHWNRRWRSVLAMHGAAD